MNTAVYGGVFLYRYPTNKGGDAYDCGGLTLSVYSVFLCKEISTNNN